MRQFLQLVPEKFIEMQGYGTLLKKLKSSGKITGFFEQTTIIWCFDELFSNRLQKVAQFVKKYKKSSISPKLCNFSRKQPCFGVFVKFSGKSCKKWLISRKCTKNHRFCQNLQVFEKTTVFRRFGELFSKKLQKVAHFVKKHEKSSICLKLAILRRNYHVSAFRSFFQEKVAEKGSFREKARKTIDLAKTFNFSSKLPCLGIFMIFSVRACKKCLIS